MQATHDEAILAKLMDTLDEAQKRWLVGREALRLGHEGVRPCRHAPCRGRS
jgi:hypothetical protein